MLSRTTFALAMIVGMASGCVERLIYEDLKGEGADDDVNHNIDVEDECVENMECAENEACFEGVCVGSGSLRFSLSWTVATDFDLHVVAPTGEHIHFAVPFTYFGHLDVDDCVSSECFDQDGTHVENIFFEDNAPRGTYQVWVQNFNGDRAGEYEIDVVGEVNRSLSGNVSANERAEGPRHEIVWE
ncbi:MAG: hypothetical protein AAF721_10740 [Myxococcota bacterium]